MTGGVIRLFIVLVSAALFTALPALVSVWQVHAQEFSSEGTSAPAFDLSLPSISSFAPATDSSSPLALQTGGEITLSARLTEEGKDISRGLVWRVFGQQAGPDGKLPLIASAEGGTSIFSLAPGGYLVHASYGRAGATKRITVGRDSKSESLVLDAGGLKLDATLAGGVRIPPAKLKFSIYEADSDATGERALIIPNVSPNSVVRLNSGVYHIVSTYGAVNAVIRSDIRIEAGKLTEATVEHHAAELTLKLVREAGGEAIADTSWSVLSGSGDPVREVVGAFASLVLAEGDYTIIAKNKDRIYQRDFTVVGGRNQDVEVLATEANTIQDMESAD
ncbi:MAG: hypothetical protein M3Y43_08065 [Pseudomonadota bacterium]|nr:hypothetical protein [Pseudomonadota bacterium]MDQ2705105.1 hypothetical protein [Pseudomonadota bacterium]